MTIGWRGRHVAENMLSGWVIERPPADGYKRLQVRVGLLEIGEGLVLGNVRSGRRYNRKCFLETVGMSASEER